jgi:hypothetical protein
MTAISKMRLFISATVAAVLVGCAASRLSDEVKPYVGRDAHELAVRLGTPTGKRETTGDRVYVWSVDSEGVLPTTANGEGTRTSGMVARYECTLEVTVDAQNIIQSYHVEGSNAGCAGFRRHLNR